MDHNSPSQEIPNPLATYLKTGQSGHCFRRRAVMTNIDDRLEILCCTVERLARCSSEQSASSRQYSNALLYEDFLTEEQCLQFANELFSGQGRLGKCKLEMHGVPHSQLQRVSTNNDYMSSAGQVVGVSLGERNAGVQIAPLLAVDQPYYPDLYEAARDWLPFTTYHGQNDGRNNQITFLLPETRAFIKGAAFHEPGKLTIEVAGTEVNALDLMVKGAYWTQGAISHFEQSVTGSKAIAAVSEDADRLEFHLLSRAGERFDFFTEDRNSRLHTSARVLHVSEKTLEARVRAATSAGEGQKIEFKPFVEPDSKMKGGGGERSKLHEVIVTAVAFANAEGGVIYMGVDDDCQIVGIKSQLSKWAEENVCDNVIDRYLGALRNCIKSNVTGELVLDTSYAWLGDALIAMIHVQATKNVPIGVRQDSYLYARAGASNRKIPPDQCRQVLEKLDRGSSPF